MNLLKCQDLEIYNLIKKEEQRQTNGIELIASENFTSGAVLETLGTCLTNKYSEGYPGHRYYGGNEYIDDIERLCCDRALNLFKLDPAEWGVNVQPLSGSPANFAVLTAVVPTDGTGRIMGLDLPSGGHLTHGYQTVLKSGEIKKISASAIYFNSKGYKTTENCNGYIDYDLLEKEALEWKPHLLITGGSAYPREWDYARLRSIANKCNAILMNDMAHVSGLIAAREVDSPFKHCDIVTTTTHKTLRGPRSGMIFYRLSGKGPGCADMDLKNLINFAVFPSLQGGPHNNVIAAVAVALKEADSEHFKMYIKQVISNTNAMANELMKKGYKLITDGTDNHLLLWDLRPLGLSGSKMEKLLEMCGITVNKNTVLGDKSAMSPGGLRIGTPAVTTRGMVENDMVWIVNVLDECVKLCLIVQEKSESKLLIHFVDVLTKPNKEYQEIQNRVNAIHTQVIEWSKNFYMSGIV